MSQYLTMTEPGRAGVVARFFLRMRKVLARISEEDSGKLLGSWPRARPTEKRPRVLKPSLEFSPNQKTPTGNFDLQAGVIRLATGQMKRGKSRVITPSDDLIAMLKKRQKQVSSSQVFGSGRSLGSFRKAWYSACVNCGFGKFQELEDDSKVDIGGLSHDLRRSAIMQWKYVGSFTK